MDRWALPIADLVPLLYLLIVLAYLMAGQTKRPTSRWMWLAYEHPLLRFAPQDWEWDFRNQPESPSYGEIIERIPSPSE